MRQQWSYILWSIQKLNSVTVFVANVLNNFTRILLMEMVIVRKLPNNRACQ